MLDWLIEINTVLWVMSNALVGYIALASVLFVVGYLILFDPLTTTAGKIVFRLMVSLAGVMVLVVIGVFLDNRPDQDWLTFRGDTIWWRPGVRLIVYGYLAYATTTLLSFLMVIKWFPSRLKTPRDKELIHLRNEGDKDNGNS